VLHAKDEPERGHERRPHAACLLVVSRGAIQFGTLVNVVIDFLIAEFLLFMIIAHMTCRRGRRLLPRLLQNRRARKRLSTRSATS
jgi:large-conductance mechanosensitive channel